MEMEIEMEMHNIDYVYLLITVSRLLSNNIFDRNSIKILIGIVEELRCRQIFRPDFKTMELKCICFSIYRMFPIPFIVFGIFTQCLEPFIFKN